MQHFAYDPLLWMGQTLGFVIMAAALGIWRQVAVVGGTSLATGLAWRQVIAMMSMQAAARFMLGLSGQLDDKLVIPWGISFPGLQGPFMLGSLMVAGLSIPAMWPMLSSVARRFGVGGKASVAAGGLGSAFSLGLCVLMSGTVESFLNLVAAWIVCGSSVGMLVTSAGLADKRLSKVRTVAAMGAVVGAGFAWVALNPRSNSAVISCVSCFLASMVLLIGLHARIKDISRGRIESTVARGVLYGLLSWSMLIVVGPLLWESASRPGGIYKDYIMSLGLLAALFTISWHFRQLGLAVAAYVERLGRDHAKALLQGLDVAAFLLDEKHLVVECSKGAESLTDISAANMIGRAPWKAFGVDAGIMGKFNRVDKNNRELIFTWVMLGTEGGNDSGASSVLTVHDVTSESLSKTALDRAAREDDLTGLPNRREAMAMVDQTIESIRGADKLGLLFLDLDHFKNVNDTEGHASGDALLREVAIILESCLSEAGGWLARLGGDEFLGVIPGGGEVECEAAARRCVESMERSQRAAKGAVGVSVGVSLFPRDGNTGQDLIRRADAAMYESKSGGRGRVSFFGPDIEDRLRRRVQVESFLRDALRADQGLALALQPICSVDGTYTGLAEALIRAPGMLGLGAQELVNIAEQSGLIMQMGRWVLRQAVVIQNEHEAQGAPITLSINVSAKQFMDDLFWEQFRGMARLGQFTNGITLEVTETTLMEDQKRAVRLLKEAKNLGAQIALDDFGAGYSSLSTLKNMPLDKLKLDKSLLDSVPEDIESCRVAQAAIAMANALGLEIVAEGVERTEQAQWLDAHGVRYIQGFLFAKPMPPPKLLELALSGPKKFLGQPIQTVVVDKSLVVI